MGREQRAVQKLRKMAAESEMSELFEEAVAKTVGPHWQPTTEKPAQILNGRGPNPSACPMTLQPERLLQKSAP